jgi:rare lipoprotein A
VYITDGFIKIMEEGAMRLCIHNNHWRCIALFLIPLALAGCGSTLKSPSPVAESIPTRQASLPKTSSSNKPALPPAGSGRGGYYLDDGPGDNTPEGLLELPDPEPQVEPYSKRGNSSYVVFGKRYTPITDDRPLKQRGIGSWYGKKFHGQKTSSGELYDMYKMTAAHPTLPIPSYARVTNIDTGKQVIVRVNDRGPFHSSRIIDLSYTAALKLGYLNKGSGQLEVERLLPDEIARIVSSRREQEVRAEQPATAPSGSSTPTLIDAPQRSAGTASLLPVAAKADTAITVVPLPAANRQSEATTVNPELVAANPATSPASASGFYIQLGAYTQAANAEAVRSRLMQDWSVTLPPIEVAEYGLFYRLHSGPFATRAEAAVAALRLQETGASKPIIVQR